MMLRTSDYRPAKLPLADMTRLGFDHWRTEWRATTADDMSSDVVGLLGCGSSTWEISTPEMWAWVNWDWAVLEGGLIAMTNPGDIRSNLLLLGEGDRYLPMHDSSAILMSVIQDLPWRDEVENLLAERSNRSELIH